MTLEIKPGNLFQEKEFEEFRNALMSREREAELFEVNLEETLEMSLSKFNAMIRLYVSMRRIGKMLQYHNFNDTVANFVDKTRFHHVFIK